MNAFPFQKVNELVNRQRIYPYLFSTILPMHIEQYKPRAGRRRWPIGDR